jgi:hypothetical protein
MGERPERIAKHIEAERSQLGSNLQELEHKVKTATDWRAQFQKHPMTMIGVAFGGGVMLSTLLGQPRRRSVRRHWPSDDEDRKLGKEATHNTGTIRQKQHAAETWDNIKGALIGGSSRKVQGFPRAGRAGL